MGRYVTPEAKKKANEAHANYNRTHYSSVLIQAPKDLVADFRRKCRESGVSQASVLKAAMQKFVEGEIE